MLSPPFNFKLYFNTSAVFVFKLIILLDKSPCFRVLAKSLDLEEIQGFDGFLLINITDKFITKLKLQNLNNTKKKDSS